MNELRLFLALVELYAHASKRHVAFVIHPTKVIQIVGVGINVELTLTDPSTWISKISAEIFRNLEHREKNVIDPELTTTEISRG